MILGPNLAHLKFLSQASINLYCRRYFPVSTWDLGVRCHTPKSFGSAFIILRIQIGVRIRVINENKIVFKKIVQNSFTTVMVNFAKQERHQIFHMSVSRPYSSVIISVRFFFRLFTPRIWICIYAGPDAGNLSRVPMRIPFRNTG